MLLVALECSGHVGPCSPSIFNMTGKDKATGKLKKENEGLKKNSQKKLKGMITTLPAVWLAQLGERRSAEREVAFSNPCRTSTQDLYNN